MTHPGAAHPAHNLAETILVLDWESTLTDSRRHGHDPRMPRLATSAGFLENMSHGWADAPRRLHVTPGAARAAADHRERLRAALPGNTLVIAAGRDHIRANDTFYDYRAHSDFLWAVGHGFQDAVLVISPGGNACLYLTPPAKPGEPDFHANANRGELWIGPVAGLAEISETLHIDTRPLAELHVPEDALIAGAAVVGSAAGRALADRKCSADLARSLAELRHIKDAWEIEQLRHAVDVTIDGFAAVRAEIPAAIAGGGERWLQGTFDRHARTAGQAPGYATIVGAGPHAPILHWVRADGEVRNNDLLLLDMGVEINSGYTADITRTLPASGSFNATQRQVHDLVEASHRAGLAAVAPGNDWAEFHHACMEVLAQGLHDWGLLPVSVDEALSEAGQHHRRYIVCGVGHHLGLDVHDCAASSFETYWGGTLEPGMALTVEPGLYFHSWDETVPPELRGIGVRIEDDLIVTETGHDVLSETLPIDADGIEKWMATAA